jgi:serine/threonine-protein phosphatase 4 regulatory subunit 1
MRPALNPPESVEVSSSPDVPIVSTDESPPPLIHHPYTYPPAQEQETSTSNVVAVSAATPGSPSLAPAMQSRSASHHGLLGSAVAASPPIGPAAVNMTSTPRTGGFSSPEGWAGRRAARSSPQSAGGDSRRARSPPVSPLWSGSGRRLTGGSSDEPALGRSPRGVSSDASGLSRRTSSGLSGRSSGSSRGSVAERMTPSETSTAGISRILNEESQFDATSLSPRTSEASPRGPSSRRPDQHELPPFSLPPSRGLPPNQTVRDEHIDRQDSGKPPEENADEPSADATTDVVPPPMQLGLEPLQPANIPKVEERSPSSIVAEGPSPRTEIDQDTVCDEVHGTGDRLPVTEFDEVMAAPKDVLPSDVAFEDEGLNTLERIFLLSKSDYPFHRWVPIGSSFSLVMVANATSHQRLCCSHVGRPARRRRPLRNSGIRSSPP